MNLENADVERCKDLIIAFAQYTANLHQAGIMHRDYSPGNILFDRIDGEYHFMLVDINRMTFGEISVDMGCANFARLWGQKAFFEMLAKEYAKARHADEAHCVERVLACRKKFWTYFAKKHMVKYKWNYRIMLYCFCFVKTNVLLMILYPIYQEALKSEDNQLLWYIHLPKIPVFPLQKEVTYTHSIQEVYDFSPEAIFVPGNIVPYYLPE